MSPLARGIFAMIFACVIWGLSPLYYELLADVPPLEVLAHRTLWSLATFAVLVAARGSFDGVRACLSSPRLIAVTLAAALIISSNWFGFIYAVQVDRAMEASLGYYISPLVAVLLGVAVFGDRLRRLQGVAVGIAASAVAILTFGLDVVPALSLMIARDMRRSWRRVIRRLFEVGGGRRGTQPC